MKVGISEYKYSCQKPITCQLWVHCLWVSPALQGAVPINKRLLSNTTIRLLNSFLGVAKNPPRLCPNSGAGLSCITLIETYLLPLIQSNANLGATVKGFCRILNQLTSRSRDFFSIRLTSSDERSRRTGLFLAKEICSVTGIKHNGVFHYCFWWWRRLCGKECG